MSEFKVGLYKNCRNGDANDGAIYQIVKRTAKFLNYIPMSYNNKYEKLMPILYGVGGDNYDYIVKKKIRKDCDEELVEIHPHGVYANNLMSIEPY